MMRSQECPSRSMKLVEFSLTRLLFTHLSSQLLVIVLFEVLVLVLLEESMRTCKVYVGIITLREMIKI